MLGTASISFIIREATRYEDGRGRNLISTSFALGVATTALVTLGFLALAGQLHSRKVRARESHPSSRAPATEPLGQQEALQPAIAQQVQESTDAQNAERVDSPEDETLPAKRRIRHIAAHRGIPELIHALGVENDPPGEAGDGMDPIAEAFALPPRFDHHVTASGYLDLEALLIEVLEEASYEVHPERGDLIASRGEERLILRVLPWDGTYSVIGRRSVERFADDFIKSGATDGICLSEAAMPRSAMELESQTAGLWFVGRGRLTRFLESLDGAMAFGSGPTRRNSADEQ